MSGVDLLLLLVADCVRRRCFLLVRRGGRRDRFSLFAVLHGECNLVHEMSQIIRLFRQKDF